MNQEIIAHLASRPIQPCPVSQMTPSQYSKWSHELALWAIKKEHLLGPDVTVALNPNYPSCTPRADYEFRDIPGRKRSMA